MNLTRWRKWRYVLTFALTAAAAILLWAAAKALPCPVTMTLFPINASPWEMSKLLFWPYLPGAVVLWRLSPEENRGGHCLLLLVMPLAAMGLTRLTAGSVPFWGIFAAVLAGGLTFYALVLRRKLWGGELLWAVLAILLGIAYILFTALPPCGRLFWPPGDVAAIAPIPY